jgi:peptidoglycan-N-acetylglucosamine deacetylase
MVVLTFDSDGGNPGNAARYLDILYAHGVEATWFLTGDFARANPSLTRRILNEGHDVGNHTVDHPDLTKPARSDSFVCSELTQANRIIAGVTGQTTRPYFRPPYGDYNTQTRTLAARLGYRTILWNIDPRDWDSNNSAQDIVNSVLNSPNLRPGAVILMHVNSAHEAEALGTVLSGLEKRGYRIVPLSYFLG